MNVAQPQSHKHHNIQLARISVHINISKIQYYEPVCKVPILLLYHMKNVILAMREQ